MVLYLVVQAVPSVVRGPHSMGRQMELEAQEHAAGLTYVMRKNQPRLYSSRKPTKENLPGGGRAAGGAIGRGGPGDIDDGGPGGPGGPARGGPGGPGGPGALGGASGAEGAAEGVGGPGGRGGPLGSIRQYAG